MEKDIFNETLLYLETHPGFLRTYFEYIQLSQAGDVKAKQLLETIIATNQDMFVIINELLNMASTGNAYARQIIIDNLKEDDK